MCIYMYLTEAWAISLNWLFCTLFKTVSTVGTRLAYPTINRNTGPSNRTHVKWKIPLPKCKTI